MQLRHCFAAERAQEVCCTVGCEYSRRRYELMQLAS